ncbi:MAG: ABC transporter ATP-binding protein [Acidobacteria bacterium]|nr:ABC transporter ATP-binding protein [Acidobacteriota bacterium]
MSAVFKFEAWREAEPVVPTAAATGKSLIQLERITKTYDSGENAVQALRGVDLRIERGEFVSIIGPSGSGKSTLMHILGCLDSPSEGRYWLDGEDVASMSARALARVRNQKLGFVFQTFNLLPRATILKNVELPLLYAGIDSDERRTRAFEALKRVGLAERAKHRPSQLSGGQRQRVAIARALMIEPGVLLLDEPTSALDVSVQAEVLNLLADLQTRRRLTYILVSHNLAVVAHVCPMIGVMQNGEMVERLSADALRAGRAQHPHTIALRALSVELEEA